MYTNWGDVNFLEYGMLVDSEHSDTVFDMLVCRPYDDLNEEGRPHYQFGHIVVDIEADWIDKKAVAKYCYGTEACDFRLADPVEFAIACTDYYSWEEFGIESYGITYDWRDVTKDVIERELKGYMIAWDNLVLEED
jgi:hypothetical protein